MMIAVLRLGHRAGRDPRISTHCALVARAFGARILFYSGDHDGGLEDSVNSIVRNWGGDFRIEYEKGWRKRISGWKGARVHLTMYGMPVLKKISEIRKSGRSKDLLVIIGGEKVHWEVYQMVDYNISVTCQPHNVIKSNMTIIKYAVQTTYFHNGFFCYINHSSKRDLRSSGLHLRMRGLFLV